MSRSARITVCVPVFRPGPLLVDTLSSIQRQTYERFRVVISIDGEDDESELMCQRFVVDPRFSVIKQSSRRGWVGNTNALLARVDTELFCIHPHDDLMNAAYLETLCRHLDRAPEAVTVFADVWMRGVVEGRLFDGALTQPSLVGSPVERQGRLLAEQFDAVAWRGLTRACALRETGPLRTNDVENFAEDTVWMAQLARAGELHRVPEALYVKRYHGRMTHSRWWAWPPEKKRYAWLIHCQEMLAEGLSVASTGVQHLTLWRAALSRLLDLRGHFRREVGGLNWIRRAALLGRFVYGALGPGASTATADVRIPRSVEHSPD